MPEPISFLQAGPEIRELRRMVDAELALERTPKLEAQHAQLVKLEAIGGRLGNDRGNGFAHFSRGG